LKISYAGGDGNDVELTALVPDLKISADKTTATFTDMDGDTASFVTTKGAWTPGMFDLIPTGNFVGGSALKTLNLTGATDFSGANLTVTATAGLFGGNGSVN